ncbi:MAG: kelch repeat-containing protein [Nannocystaceae bacterium]
MSLTRASTLVLGVLTAGCFNPPSIDDSTTDASSSSGPTPTPPADSSTGPGPATTADTTDSGPPLTTTGEDTTTGEGSSESTAAPVEPEIEVSIGGQPFESGDELQSPVALDVGDLGPVITVQVSNTGDGDLNLSGISLTGPAVNHYQLSIMGLDASLAPGESTTFDLRFAPLNGGLKEVVAEIGSNDADEDPFTVRFRAHTTPNLYRPLTPLGSPQARFNMAMAPLPDSRILMFGGRNNADVRLGDTWVLDVEANAWTQLSPAASPSPRDAHEMAYIGNDTVVLFGGNDVSGGGAVGLGDTWVFDTAAEQWSPVVTPGPGPRFQHMMVSLGTEALLFGGRSGGPHLSDTWRFDGATQTWLDLVPVGAPGPRITAAMAFNGDDTVVLYGGFLNNTPLSDTHEYTVSTNSWSQIPPGFSPGARGTLEGDFLETGAMVVYSGKLDTCCNDPDPGTFGYAAAVDTWLSLMPTAEPTPRYNYGMVAVPGGNKLIIFGGQLQNGGAGSSVDDTIEYVGPLP